MSNLNPDVPFPLEPFNLDKCLTKEDGYFKLNVDSNNLEHLLNLLRLDKDHLSNLFDKIFLEAISKYKIKSPAQAETKFCNFLFRGQRDCNWKLQPLVFRDGKVDVHKELEELKFFIEVADKSGTQIPNDSVILRNQLNQVPKNSSILTSNNWCASPEYHDLMAYAQHYGASTRLLDWSAHPLVSLYFSTEKITHKDYEFNHPFSLWVLCTDYLPTKISIVKVPKSINKRISYQQGCFTLVEQHPAMNRGNARDTYKRLNTPWDESNKLINDVLIEEHQDYSLLKINIPPECAITVFKYCFYMNFHANSLLGDFEKYLTEFRKIKQ